VEKKIAGLIVAGGQGARMGAEKPLRPFMAGVLLDAVIARVGPQVSCLALNVHAEAVARYRARSAELPIVADRGPAMGPLAGLLAGLAWLNDQQRCDWLALFPCDTPFLPRQLVAMLASVKQDDCVPRPVVAFAEGHVQSLCSLWPATAFDSVIGNCDSVRDALSTLGALHYDFGDTGAAFFNVNTPEDLAEAERLAPLYP
jgi:molybdopterin-guanine dinucleotide biosynthesis protein A